MSSSEPVGELSETLRSATGGADLELAADLVMAARGDRADAELAAVAETALSAGIAREDVIRACDAARRQIRMRAGAFRNYEDAAEDHVLDLMDRLTRWCAPGAELLRGTRFGN